MKLEDTCPWKKSYHQPRQHIKKQRPYFVNKGPSSQGYGFSSGHVWCKSWTIKKAECWRIDAFELWCWRRLLRVPCIAKRSNQSILKEISPECSLEGLMLKLKLQYFGQLKRRTDSFEKTLMLEGLGAGGEGDDRGWDGWMASPTRWTWVWVNSGSWWWTGRPGVLQSMGSQRVVHDWETKLNWIEIQQSGDTSSFQGTLLASYGVMMQKRRSGNTVWKMNMHFKMQQILVLSSRFRDELRGI